MRKPRTLIIDDDVELLKTLTSQFKDLGHTPVPYQYVNAEQIGQVKEAHIDLMDLDNG